MLRRINKKCGFAIGIAICRGRSVTKETCQYPGHAGIRKRIQGRYVIPYMCQDIQKLFGVIIPVGSGSLQ